MPGEQVLVLGATGFIGSNVAEALLGAGYAVRGLARPGRSRRAAEGLDLEWVEGDLRDRGGLARAAEGCDAILHAAGHYPTSSLDPRETLKRGVTEMRNVLHAAREANVRKLVYTSSLSTLGPPGEENRLADERDLYLPGTSIDPYFEVKWLMEAEALRAAAQGLDVTVVNPTLTFGPRDAKPTSGRIVLETARGRLPFYVDAEFNMIHVRDVALGHVSALEKGRTGERYVLGHENVHTVDLIQMIADEAGVKAPTRRIGYGAALAASFVTEVGAKLGFEVGKRLRNVAPHTSKTLIRPPYLPLEAVELFAHAQPLSAEKARKELGLPQTPVREAIRDALDWFRAHDYWAPGLKDAPDR